MFKNKIVVDSELSDKLLEAEIQKGRDKERRLQKDMYITLNKEKLLPEARKWLRLIDEEKVDKLRELGYNLYSVGDNQYLISSVPAGNNLLDDVMSILIDDLI